jgi:hypothetical protein
VKPQQQGAAAATQWTSPGPCRWEATISGRRVAITMDDSVQPYRVEVLDGRRAGTTNRVNTLKEAKRHAERMAG